MTRSPSLAAGLSLVLPGGGQLYNGERAKGIAVLCIDAGIVLGIALATVGPLAFRSRLTVVILGLVYVFIWIPAVIDAYQQAAGRAKPILSGDRVWYVVFMLLAVGPAAIPLLWHSPRFSRAAKIGLTVAVILLAIALIFLTVVVAPWVEQLFQEATSDPALHDLLNSFK